MNRSFAEYVSRKQAEYGEKFSQSSLAPQFVEAYERGDTYRVQVDFGYGEKPVWGFVGVTTGWVPAFLLMRRRGQYGSSETLNDKCRILATRTIR